MVLVDTSVWVTHLRQGHKRLASCLEQGLVVCHPFVIGELACSSISNRTEFLSLLEALPKAQLATHEEVLDFIERHTLFGAGLGYVDAHLLGSSALTNTALWTLDKNLKKAATKLQLQYDSTD